LVVLFGFLERVSDLLRSTCGPFWNGHKKTRETIETDVATPTFRIAYSD